MRVLVHICCGPCAITVLRHLSEHGYQPTGYFFNPNIQPLAEYLRRREGAARVADRLGLPLIFADTLPPEEQVWDDPWLPGPASGLSGSLFGHVPDGVLDGTSEGVSGDTPESTSGGTLDGRPEGASGGAPEGASGAALPFAPGKPPVAPAANPVPWLRAVSGREGERCLFCWRVRLRHSAQSAKRLGFDAITSSLLYSRYQDHEKIRELGQNAADEAGVGFVYEDFRRYWQQGIDLSREWEIYRQPYCGCLFSEYDRYSKPLARTLAARE